MFTRKYTEDAPHLADQAVQSAEQAVESTQRLAHEARDRLSDTVQALGQPVTPLLDRATRSAGVLAQRGADAIRDGSQQLREQTLRTVDRTVTYIRDEPIKSVLIAAATGAALMALLSLVRRTRTTSA